MCRMQEVLEGISDHRGLHGRRYSLSSIIRLVICGFLCGCDNLASVSRFADRLTREQRRQLGFSPSHVPCHSNLCVVLQGVDTEALEAALSRFVRGDRPFSGHLSLDGKVLRGSAGEGKAVHLLACFAHALHGVVEQLPIPEGGNEITAALALLERLKLCDTVITGDAIFAQQEICRTIRAKGGHYLFTLKDNQKSLRTAVEQAFDTEKKREDA